MPRTTLNIDAEVFRELRRRQRSLGKSLGDIASELLAQALSDHHDAGQLPPLEWHAQPLQPRVDLDDKDAVHRILDES